MTYNGGTKKWSGATGPNLTDVSEIGTSGTMYGVYFPFGDVAVLSDGAGGVTLARTLYKTLVSHSTVRFDMTGESASSWKRTGFRGYEISKGVLMRNSNGTYTLTSGDDPFELYSYYGDDSSKNRVYFRWSFLKSDEELGNGSTIVRDHEKLPAGWLALEAADCVFLPVTNGRRSGSSFYDTARGVYYGNHTAPRAVRFGSNHLVWNITLNYDACSVRMVHEIN